MSWSCLASRRLAAGIRGLLGSRSQDTGYQIYARRKSYAAGVRRGRYGCGVADAGVVRVVLLDADDGTEVASMQMPAGQLPASLQPGTELYVDDGIWEITRAEPADVAYAVASGKLAIWARRIELVTSTGILFSTPTICEVLAPTDPTASTTGLWLLHEDDWRQIEWIHRSLIDIVTAEIQQVRRVHRDHTHPGAPIVGYSACHGRRQPVAPLAGTVQASAWHRLLPAPAHRFEGLGYHDWPGAVRNGFASSLDGFVIYGVTGRDQLIVLGIAIDPSASTPATADGFGESIAGAMDTLDLVLVDWPRAEVIGPEHVRQYLSSQTARAD